MRVRFASASKSSSTVTLAHSLNLNIHSATHCSHMLHHHTLLASIAHTNRPLPLLQLYADPNQITLPSLLSIFSSVITIDIFNRRAIRDAYPVRNMRPKLGVAALLI